MTTNKDLFAKHISLGTFVETGTCFGRSVEIALKLGFKYILSVEGDRTRFEHCDAKFLNDENVAIWHGHSPDKLPIMLSAVPRFPILYWLDAHPSGPASFGQDYEANPEYHQSNILRAELTIIKERNVKGDVILIDDLTADVHEFARQLFPDAVFLLHSTDEGADKVLEVVT